MFLKNMGKLGLVWSDIECWLIIWPPITLKKKYFARNITQTTLVTYPSGTLISVKSRIFTYSQIG